MTISPAVGWLARLKKPTAARCGSSSTSSSELTGPAGISSSSSNAIHSRVVRLASCFAGDAIDVLDVASARGDIDETRILHHLGLLEALQNRSHCWSV